MLRLKSCHLLQIRPHLKQVLGLCLKEVHYFRLYLPSQRAVFLPTMVDRQLTDR